MTFSFKPTELFQAILLLPLGCAVMHMRPEATAYCFRSMKVRGARGHHGPPVKDMQRGAPSYACWVIKVPMNYRYIYHYLPINIYKP